MINFTKSINDNFGNPYIEVDSSVDEAIEANNGKFYLSKEQVETRFNEGDFVLEFLQDYELEKPIVIKWTKDSHISEISCLHDELFNSILSEYGYTSFAELSIWAQEPTNEYYKEANLIKDWYRATWLLIRDYSNVVIEETKIDPQEFINSLPKL